MGCPSTLDHSLQGHFIHLLCNIDWATNHTHPERVVDKIEQGIEGVHTICVTKDEATYYDPSPFGENGPLYCFRWERKLRVREKVWRTDHR